MSPTLVRYCGAWSCVDFRQDEWFVRFLPWERTFWHPQWRFFRCMFLFWYLISSLNIFEGLLLVLQTILFGIHSSPIFFDPLHHILPDITLGNFARIAQAFLIKIFLKMFSDMFKRQSTWHSICVCAWHMYDQTSYLAFYLAFPIAYVW